MTHADMLTLPVDLGARSYDIVVGHGARHTATAAGLEGSWDGESVLVADLDEAYAVLRSHLRPGDALLISAAARTPLADLVDRLTQEASW